MKVRIRDFFPPGFEYDKTCKAFVGSIAASVVYSFNFFANYSRERKWLFEWVLRKGEIYSQKVLREGAKIVPFQELIGYSFALFIVVFAVAIYSMVLQLLYYREGSKSIYLVKRLPDQNYLWRTCFAGPMLGFVITLFVIGLLLAIYYGVYIIFTPAQCLP